jgi:hypothetical protein
MRVLIFSPTFVQIISHSKKKCARCDKKYLLVLMENVFLFCPILMKFEFSRQVFEKCSDIKFHENPSIGSRVFPCGRTNSHGEAVRKFANAPKNRYKREQCALTLHDTSQPWQMGPHGSLYQGYYNLWYVDQLGIFRRRYAFTWKSCYFSEYSSWLRG